MLSFVTFIQQSRFRFAKNLFLSKSLTTVCVLLCLSSFFTGCREDDRLEPKLVACAELPAALGSENKELVKLVRDLKRSGTLPKQLDNPLSDPSSNAALVLQAGISADERVGLSERLPWVTLRESLPFDPEILIETADVMKKNSGLIDRISAASDKPRCTYQINHIYGYFGPNKYLDNTQIAVRLLMARAYDAGFSGDAAKALKDIERAFRWTHWLSRVKKPEARVHAATLRSEVLDLVSELINTGKFRRQEAALVYGLLRDQLANWPADHRMLEGDRAAGAHAYEAIRMGLAKKILTFDEQHSLERNDELEKFLEPVPAALDQDEVNYLLAMQVFIKASIQGPFHERIEAIEKARVLASQKPNLFADRFFLIDLIDAQRAAARDRTLCEAWCLALASAANQATPNFLVAPINGRQYQIKEDGSQVTVVVGNPQIIDPSIPQL